MRCKYMFFKLDLIHSTCNKENKKIKKNYCNLKSFFAFKMLESENFDVFSYKIIQTAYSSEKMLITEQLLVYTRFYVQLRDRLFCTSAQMKSSHQTGSKYYTPVTASFVCSATQSSINYCKFSPDFL